MTIVFTQESISNLILKYNEYGFLDQLHRKWYGRVHCLESSSLTKPKPLTVRAEAGVFLMLAVGIGIGVVILVLEHLVFKYVLPALRKKNKNCFWKSPNLMFFSQVSFSFFFFTLFIVTFFVVLKQKLYRFINTVELVSPHHSAKEIISNLKEGQIASLFQKSVKRVRIFVFCSLQYFFYVFRNKQTFLTNGFIVVLFLVMFLSLK